MKAPDKIWVTPSELTSILAEKRHDYDEAYIRKDYLLEWLNKAKIAANNDGIRAGFQIVINNIESL